MEERVSCVVANIDVTTTFELKITMKKVGGNGRGNSVSTLLNMAFSYEDKRRDCVPENGN